MARVKVLPSEGVWVGRLAWLAVALGVGALLSALIAAIGSGQGAWSFRSGLAVRRYAFFAGIAGGILAVVAIILMKDKPSVRRRWALLLALFSGFGLAGYLGNQYMTATSLPAIHDITTDLEDVPDFSALPVRPDNLENVPDQGEPELAAMEPEARWKALHRAAYGDLKTISVPWSVAETIQRAQTVAEKNGWEIVHVDPSRGRLEATDTTTFFRFRDDVVVRARRDPQKPGRTLVDMRSISRVGGSDIGVNARRIRDYLQDLKQS
jgi:hypothetical protein